MKDKEDETPSKKRRRIIRDEDLTESTKNATQLEEERRARIADRQKNYNKIFEIDLEVSVNSPVHGRQFAVKKCLFRLS